MNDLEILSLAHTLGSHPARLVIWDEGSVAARTDAGFVVSGSGASLASLTANDLAEFDIAKVDALSAEMTVSEESLAEIFPPEMPAPSSDVFLYAQLFAFDGIKFAAHLHPVEINQIISSPRARQFADRRTLPHEILGYGAATLLVPYADLGLPLARETRKKLVLWRDRHKTAPRVILLQNHGMIVLGETAQAVLRTTEMVLKSAQVFIGSSLLGGPVFLTPNQVAGVEARGRS